MSARRKFQQLRAAGLKASEALRSAKIWEAFEEAEAEGLLRLQQIPEQGGPFDSFGEPEAYQDPSGRRISAEEAKAEALRLADLWGGWIVSVEIFRPACEICGRPEGWKALDSVGGFWGYEDPLSPLQNPYAADLMQQGLEALEEEPASEAA